MLRKVEMTGKDLHWVQWTRSKGSFGRRSSWAAKTVCSQMFPHKLIMYFRVRHNSLNFHSFIQYWATFSESANKRVYFLLQQPQLKDTCYKRNAERKPSAFAHGWSGATFNFSAVGVWTVFCSELGCQLHRLINKISCVCGQNAQKITNHIYHLSDTTLKCLQSYETSGEKELEERSHTFEFEQRSRRRT